MNQLLGIVLLPRPGDVRRMAGPASRESGTISRSFPRQVGLVLQSYIGKPVSLAFPRPDGQGRDRRLSRGRPPRRRCAHPEQDITSGVVQLVVIESELARIRVEGVDADTEEFIRSQMRIKKGEVIRASEVLPGSLVGQPQPLSPDRHGLCSRLRVRDHRHHPQELSDQGQLVLHTATRTPALIISVKTVQRRFNMGDAFGPNRSLSYQYTSDFDMEHVRANSLVYTHALPWRHWITVLASYVDINSDPIPIGGGNTLDSDGDNVQLSARYGIPLDGTANRQREMDFGFDWKSNGNNLVRRFHQHRNVQLFGSRSRSPVQPRIQRDHPAPARGEPV